VWKNENADVGKGREKMLLRMGQWEMVYNRMGKRHEEIFF
jgi:hypothetical protein